MIWNSRLRVAAATAIVGALLVCTTSDGQEPGGARVVHQVAIRGMLFVPADLEVKRGERVRWTNEDLVPHTVTASNKLFDSSIIPPNASWEWTAAGEGKIVYGCTIHSTMKGSLTVH